ncbi:uncharacterized protein K452DRAFT_292770 [Aplosporella prunicola CBS 121167]|uniref:Uncharacterized protein n=1 Tax=Aplosporella prunicola CBS 121167 TaxID=1176127 RepID=A0A6A6AYC7_9PEZI|nr:uncharacterized protein K452DRAFT_292770 [Aplosporella prunicola CBS 121167]KAF2135975.1 hypothetical protein K452DRAFT_292770 [Aplosporella prunicola CBS 121167]
MRPALPVFVPASTALGNASVPFDAGVLHTEMHPAVAIKRAQVDRALQAEKAQAVGRGGARRVSRGRGRGHGSGC